MADQIKPAEVADQQTFDADTCERIFHAALGAGDIEGVHAALTVMAPQDPHRAEYLLDALRLGLTLATIRGGTLRPGGDPNA